MFAVITGGAGAFTVETVGRYGHARMVGLRLATLDRAAKHAPFGNPIELLHSSACFINLSTRRCHRTAKFYDIVEVEYTRLIIHRRIVTARVIGKLFC